MCFKKYDTLEKIYPIYISGGRCKEEKPVSGEAGKGDKG
jgi:hypothetical protein